MPDPRTSRDLAAGGRKRSYEHGSDEAARLPEWLRRPIANPGHAIEVGELLSELQLSTVCRSAKCPNRGECFSAGTATFLIAGDSCTRDCRFCAVEPGVPAPLDHGEPDRVAEAARRMALRHVVITMVTRDDIDDGAAAHVVSTVQAVRAAVSDATIEVLTSDFGGRMESVTTVLGARPDVFNHNIETVPRLYAEVRPGADYARSLDVLRHAGSLGATTKSGLMLGLGETPAEVVAVMGELRQAGVSMLTLGQYLRPSARHLPVAEFVEPAVFSELEREAQRAGFSAVASAPFVRSSYHAGELASATAHVAAT